MSLPERAAYPACEAHVSVDVHHRVGTLELDAAFATRAPWTVLFGPSGSGKSTLLRMIAGLTRPATGRIALGGTVVVDTDAGVWMPAHKRPMRWAGQREKLFPLKTVKWNLPIGMNVREPVFSRRARMDEMERAIDHFDLRELSENLPEQLSGGQRQRVAVARAAAGAGGKVLLLDEPFTGLDAQVRDELIAQLRSWLGKTPVISVTHDVGEAFLLRS